MSDSSEPTGSSTHTDKTTRLVVALFVVLLVVVAAAALLLLPIGWWSAGPSALRHPAVGQRLSRLELQPLTGHGRHGPGTGQPISLDDLAGRVVLLNFWGTWCPPCLVELPDMARIESTFRDRDDFKFLAVSCGQGPSEDAEDLRLNTASLLFSAQIDMPTYSDPGGVSRLDAHQVVGLEFFPTTVVLDRGGLIRGVWVGPADKDELEDLITQLLQEQRRPT